MKILVIGSGGREHALCSALKKSRRVTSLYCSPGNGGIREVAQCLPLKDFQEIGYFCQENDIDLVMIGPEQPLVDGLADYLRERGVRVFGPSKLAAQLEGSKGFTKDICAKYNIPTGAYQRFSQAEPAKEYLARQSMPIVIKADGLAAGKGVIISHRRREAERVIDEMFAGMFGAASAEIVIEEYLEGEEISFFALCDGETAVEFGSAQDHKRAHDGDTGPNTGGMGTYAPAPIVTDELRAQIMKEVIYPTVKAMKQEGMPFTGVLFAGLMLTREGPRLIEFNTRFGDPEAQVLLSRLDEDLAEILYRAAEGKLPARPLKFKDQAAVCVVMAANGYPGEYVKGTEIKNIAAAEALKDVAVFHAGTQSDNGKIIATGGRVLGVTALGSSVREARDRAYEAVKKIDWPEGFCRNDIAWRALSPDQDSVAS